MSRTLIEHILSGEVDKYNEQKTHCSMNYGFNAPMPVAYLAVSENVYEGIQNRKHRHIAFVQTCERCKKRCERKVRKERVVIVDNASQA